MSTRALIIKQTRVRRERIICRAKLEKNPETANLRMLKSVFRDYKSRFFQVRNAKRRTFRASPPEHLFLRLHPAESSPMHICAKCAELICGSFCAVFCQSAGRLRVRYFCLFRRRFCFICRHEFCPPRTFRFPQRTNAFSLRAKHLSSSHKSSHERAKVCAQP